MEERAGVEGGQVSDLGVRLGWEKGGKWDSLNPLRARGRGEPGRPFHGLRGPQKRVVLEGRDKGAKTGSKGVPPEDAGHVRRGFILFIREGVTYYRVLRKPRGVII